MTQYSAIAMASPKFKAEEKAPTVEVKKKPAKKKAAKKRKG